MPENLELSPKTSANPLISLCDTGPPKLCLICSSVCQRAAINCVTTDTTISCSVRDGHVATFQLTNTTHKPVIYNFVQPCKLTRIDTHAPLLSLSVSPHTRLFPPRSDCVQFQSHRRVSGFVSAAQGVCGSPGRDLGPQRHSDSAGGPGHCLCRYTQSLHWLFTFTALLFCYMLHSGFQ